MIDFLKKLFSENGGVSMMRIMTLACCLAAITMAIVGLSKVPVDYSGLSLLCSTFLAGAFGGKVAQKKLEVNGTKTETEVDTGAPK